MRVIPFAVLVAILAYLGAGALLLNNGSDAFFPRQIVVALTGTAAGSMVVAVGAPRARRAAFAMVTLSAALAAFLMLPPLEDLRLRAMHGTIPIADPAAVEGRATCFCGRRASIFELFGRPDLATHGIALAERFVYWLDREHEHAVVYRFRPAAGGLEDLLISIDRRHATAEELAADGLLPMVSR